MAQLDGSPIHDSPPHGRPAYRVPIGMPVRDEGRRASMLVSVAVHALIVVLLLVPLFLPDTVLARIEQGAGGDGPAGGGGGGRRGTGGGTVETLRYVRLAPDPVPTPTTLPAITPPVPKVVVPPPLPVVPPVKAPDPVPEKTSAAPAPQAVVAAITPGTGGGSGNDGTTGAGPGSGGGVGAGIGTGRGSANGPGTGGGNQVNYPPQPTQFFIPPIPQPANVRGFTMIANFDVDSTGRVLDFKFTETPNRDYNRSLASVLRAMRFRPGTRPDGTPVRMTWQFSIDF